MTPTSFARVTQLLQGLIEGKIAPGDFCVTFERVWNLEVDRKDVPEAAFESLSMLFDEVVLYSPLPRSEWQYPKYRDDHAIMAAGKRAFAALQAVGYFKDSTVGAGD